MKKSESNFSDGQNKAFANAGESLRTIREKKGLSQEDVAFEAKMDQSSLSKLERLGPQIVSWTKLAAVAHAIDCVIEVNFREKTTE